MRTSAVLLAIVLTACQVTPGDQLLPGQPVAFRRDPAFQEYRYYSGVDRPETSVIRDAEEWERTWTRVIGSRAPKPATPFVDFAREMVVLVAIGSRSTGGYSAEIIQVVTNGSGIGVDYRATAPGANCITTQAFTQPLDLVIAPRIEGTTRFARHDRVQDC